MLGPLAKAEQYTPAETESEPKPQCVLKSWSWRMVDAAAGRSGQVARPSMPWTWFLKQEQSCAGCWRESWRETQRRTASRANTDPGSPHQHLIPVFGLGLSVHSWSGCDLPPPSTMSLTWHARRIFRESCVPGQWFSKMANDVAVGGRVVVGPAGRLPRKRGMAGSTWSPLSETDRDLS